MHGKPSSVRMCGGRLLCGLPSEFIVGRYHSLHAVRSHLPPELSVTAETEAGVIMAVEHQRLPIAAVQFHPESVMTLREEIGMPIIASVMAALPPNPPRGQGRGGATRRRRPASPRRPNRPTGPPP